MDQIWSPVSGNREQYACFPPVVRPAAPRVPQSAPTRTTGWAGVLAAGGDFALGLLPLPDAQADRQSPPPMSTAATPAANSPSRSRRDPEPNFASLLPCRAARAEPPSDRWRPVLDAVADKPSAIASAKAVHVS